MTRLLVSVTDVDESLLALEAGADIIDLKNPAKGALGALPLPVVRQVVRAVGGRRPVSATIGDLPMQAGQVAAAVAETADAGVDIVKIGFFGSTGHAACIDALAPFADRGVRMVAVQFADQAVDPGLNACLAKAGFLGVMLDTARKGGRRLRDWMGDDELHSFAASAREQGLLAGLAGSLVIANITTLAECGADYLGFRGGLCRDSSRLAVLEHERVVQAVEMLRKCNMPDRVIAKNLMAVESGSLPV